MKDSKIEWCDDTVNLWWGCTEVHAGCDNCYARVLANRWGKQLWGNDAPRERKPNAFKLLASLQAKAKAANQVRRVFVGSMMDIFEKPMPVAGDNGCLDSTSDIRDLFFMNVDRGLYPNLMFLLLTKRPSNIKKYIPTEWQRNPPANVMYGATVVNQATYSSVMGHLSLVRGRKFLSVEPQLEKIVLFGLDGGELQWIIQGGESGHHKRPFNTEWAYSMQQDCADLGIPYFFKQIDKVQPIPEGLQIRQFPV